MAITFQWWAEWGLASIPFISWVLDNPETILPVIAMLLGGIIVFFWIWGVLWIVKDISLRTNNVFTQLFSIILGLIPIVGIPLYILIRPVQYLYDQGHWRDALEINIIQCPKCKHGNPTSHSFCHHCGTNIAVVCKETNKSYPNAYQYSPYSGEPNLESK